MDNVPAETLQNSLTRRTPDGPNGLAAPPVGVPGNLTPDGGGSSPGAGTRLAFDAVNEPI